MLLEIFAKNLLKIMNWKIEGQHSETGKHVYCLYPHTTIWDTPIFLLVGLAVMKDKKFLIAVKESFDKPLLKNICDKFNLLPIQRNSSGLRKMISVMNEKNLNIGLAIEGTRKKADGIKPGFYVIAKKAKIPYVILTINWHTKIIKMFDPIEVDETFELTIQKIAGLVEPLRPLGKYPENESPIIPA